MIVDNNARYIKARELNDTLVGEPFSYQGPNGDLHARIAMVEVRNSEVNVTLDGVIKDGSSVVLVFGPNEELIFTPMH